MKDWDLVPARDLGLPQGERLRSLHRENWLLEAFSHFGWIVFLRVVLRMIHRLEVQGRDRLPLKPPFILVGNHSSHLDTLVLASALPLRLCDRTFPIAAGDHFFQRSSSTLFAATLLNALPIWRKSFQKEHMDALRRRLLEDACVYILFPEGTRSRDGRMGGFRPGIGMLVAGSQVPVVPCYIDGAFRSMPPHRYFPSPTRLKLRIGEPRHFSSATNDREGWMEIANQLRQDVEALSRG